MRSSTNRFRIEFDVDLEPKSTRKDIERIIKKAFAGSNPEVHNCKGLGLHQKPLDGGVMLMAQAGALVDAVTNEFGVPMRLILSQSKRHRTQQARWELWIRMADAGFKLKEISALTGHVASSVSYGVNHYRAKKANVQSA